MSEMKIVKTAFIGLGARGVPTLKLLCSLEGVLVTAVCDKYEDRVQNGIDAVKEVAGNTPFGTQDYKEVLAREDVEAVVICTDWNTHIPIAIAAMEAGKQTAMEVCGAYSVDECYDLVKAYERTGIHCMFLENGCYHEHRLALYHMVKQGVFGELIHMEGAYAHDLRSEIGHGLENRHYRFRNFQRRDGDLYPTHDVGPIAKMLDINRGNRMVALSSFSSKARGMHEYMVANYGPDHEYAKINWNQGDIVTTMIKCANGETILLLHDDTLPRVYSREFKVQGTKGLYVDYGKWEDQRLFLEEDPAKPVEEVWRDFSAEFRDKYQHPLWRKVKRENMLGGAHGPIDELVLRAFIESVQRGIAPPIDTYDGATWMALTALSEQSVAMGGAVVPIPDFTRGQWIDREPAPRSIYALDDICYELFDEQDVVPCKPYED